MALRYYRNFAAGGKSVFPSTFPEGFNAWIHNTAQAASFRSVNVAAHQGYTANAASTLHWTVDDSYDVTGKLQRWNDNGGVWTSAQVLNGLQTIVNGFAGAANIDHFGGLKYSEDSGAGKLYISANKDIGDTDNAIVVADPFTLNVDSVNMLVGGTADANACAVYANEVYVSSNNGVGVDVYDLATWAFKRAIDFDPSMPFPALGNGIDVNENGIYVSADKQVYHWDLSGKAIAGFHIDNGVNDNSVYDDDGGLQDIHIDGDTMRLLFDGGGDSYIKYFEAPNAPRGTIDSDGFTVSGDGSNDSGCGIFIHDTDAGNMPTAGTIFMQVRPNRFYDEVVAGYGNTLFSNARSRHHQWCAVQANGVVRYKPNSGINILSAALPSADQFYTIALVWDATGGPLARANLYIDGVAVGADVAGNWSNQQKMYGFGGMGEFPEINDGEATYHRIAIYNDARPAVEIENFVWPDDDPITTVESIANAANIRAELGIGGASTQVELRDINAVINTTDKVLGKPRFDSTNGRMVYASGTAANSAWRYHDGTLAHAPV